MIIDRNSTAAIGPKHTLELEYESNEPTGKLRVRIIDLATERVGETRLDLDPWSPEGYAVTPWSAASSLFIAGADRIVLLSLDRPTLVCSISYDHEEYETLHEPIMVISADTCLVASESRITCIDRRNAIRWSWSVRTSPASEWAQLAGPPVVAGDVVRVPIRTRTKDLEIAIGLVDGARM